MKSKSIIGLAILVCLGAAIVFVSQYKGNATKAGPPENSGAQAGAAARDQPEAASPAPVAPDETPAPAASPEDRASAEVGEKAARVVDTGADPLMGFLADPDAAADAKDLVWETAAGDGDVADRFQKLRALSATDYENMKLNRAQDDVILASIRAIGLLGAHDDEAYGYSVRGSDTDYWKSNRTWQSERGAYIDDLLTSFSIQAVGLSGREVARKLLDEYKKEKDANYLHRFAGDVTQAAFYVSFREQQGEGALKDHMLGPDDDGARFGQWIQTDEGREWFEWANDRMRGPRPN